MENFIRTQIILPGHATCTDVRRASYDDAWIKEFNYPNQAILYVEHIRHACLLARAFPDSAITFSGGQTRKDAGELSEAKSYFEIAKRKKFLEFSNAESRVFLEEYARDSLENVLLSICLFKKNLGRYPEKIVVVGFEFKSKRFQFHISSLNWPRIFEYHGINNPVSSQLPYSIKGENNKLLEIINDRFCLSDKWKELRKNRDPFGRGYPQELIPPELKSFFDFIYAQGAPTLPTFTI